MVKQAENNNSRPNQVILDNFYALADLKQSKRCEAASKILKEVEKADEKTVNYCLERLVKGLSSSRLATRVGFSVTLCELSKRLNDAQLSSIFDIIEKLPKETSNDSYTNHAFAQVLSCLAVARSLRDGRVSDEILTKLLGVVSSNFEKFAYLQPTCVQCILIITSKVNEEKFKEKIWPSVKTVCRCCSVDEISTNKIWLIFGLRKIHGGKFLSKKCPFSNFNNGSIFNDEDQMSKLASIIIAASHTYPKIHPGVLLLVERIFDDDDWLSKVWPKYFEATILKHERKSVTAYGYQLLSRCLEYVKSDTQAKLIFTKQLFECVSKSLTDKNAASRFSRQFAAVFLEDLCKFFKRKVENEQNLCKSAATSQILPNIFDISLDFDRDTGGKLVKTAISSLNNDRKSTEDIVDYLFERYHRLADDADIENNRKIKTTNDILKNLLQIFTCNPKLEECRSQILNFITEILLPVSPEEKIDRKFATSTFFDCIERLSDVVIRPNLINIGITPNNLTLLSNNVNHSYELFHRKNSTEDSAPLEEIKAAVKKSKKFFHKCFKHSVDQEKSSIPKGFAVLLGYFTLKTIFEPAEYQKTLKEIVACYEESNNYSASGPNNNVDNDEDSWIDVLIDLALSLLSKESRHRRIPVQVALSVMSSVLKPRHLEPILKVLDTEFADELMDAEDDEDESGEDFEPIDDATDNNKDSVGDLKKTLNNDEKSEGSSDEEDEEDDQQVDPEFSNALEKALKDADALETASVHSDLSDDTMLKLDEKLADVFRMHAKGPKSAHAQREKDVQAFRMRCSDLLLILIHSIRNVDTLVSLVTPLLKAYLHANKSKAEQHVLVNRLKALLNVLNGLKTDKLKVSTVSDNKVSTVSEKLIEITQEIFALCKTTSDMLFQQSAAGCVRFLSKIAEKLENIEEKRAYENQLKQLIEQELTEFLHNPACLTSDSMFNVIFERYTHLFWYKLPGFVGILSDKSIRQFRRIDICQILLRFLSIAKNTLNDLDKSMKKTWKKFLRAFHAYLSTPLDEVLKNVENSSSSAKNVADAEESAKSEKSAANQINPRFLIALLKLARNLCTILKLDNEEADVKCEDVKDEDDHGEDELRTLLLKFSNIQYRKHPSLNSLQLAIRKEFSKTPHAFFAHLANNLQHLGKRKHHTEHVEDKNSGETANDYESVKKKLKF